MIREGLRLFPPLCAPPIYKEVPAGGDVVCGKHLPAGTWVATGNQMWHGMRERAFWGGDADVFRPERWLFLEEEVEGAAGAGVGGLGEGVEGREKGVEGREKGGSAERLAQMNRRVELAFGSGQFVCVGRGVAMVELGKVLGEVGLFSCCFSCCFVLLCLWMRMSLCVDGWLTDRGSC